MLDEIKTDGLMLTEERYLAISNSFCPWVVAMRERTEDWPGIKLGNCAITRYSAGRMAFFKAKNVQSRGELQLFRI